MVAKSWPSLKGQRLRSCTLQVPEAQWGAPELHSLTLPSKQPLTAEVYQTFVLVYESCVLYINSAKKMKLAGHACFLQYLVLLGTRSMVRALRPEAYTERVP